MQQDFARVTVMCSDVDDLAILNLREQFCDTIHERFATDIADLRVPCSLVYKMFGTAKADLDPDPLGHKVEKTGGIFDRPR